MPPHSIPTIYPYSIDIPHPSSSTCGSRVGIRNRSLLRKSLSLSLSLFNRIFLSLIIFFIIISSVIWSTMGFLASSQVRVVCSPPPFLVITLPFPPLGGRGE